MGICKRAYWMQKIENQKMICTLIKNIANKYSNNSLSQKERGEEQWMGVWLS